jgi:hypothetical protein
MTLKGWVTYFGAKRPNRSCSRISHQVLVPISPAITWSLMTDARISLKIADSFGGD